ncbi:hypothetical protein AWC17_13370, partial [Mycobacterium nebraskense]
MKKMWIVLVIVLVVAVAGFCVLRLRTFFGVHDDQTMTSGVADEIKPLDPKRVVYQVYGPPPTLANASYLDASVQRRRATNARLRWTPSAPSTRVNIVTRGSASNRIGCAIIVDEVVKDERSSQGMNAQTFCIVK